MTAGKKTLLKPVRQVVPRRMDLYLLEHNLDVSKIVTKTQDMLEFRLGDDVLRIELKDENKTFCRFKSCKRCRKFIKGVNDKAFAVLVQRINDHSPRP